MDAFLCGVPFYAGCLIYICVHKCILVVAIKIGANIHGCLFCLDAYLCGCLLSWAPSRFSLLTVGYEVTQGCPMSPLTVQITLMPLSLGLISTQQVPLISHSTCSVKLLVVLPESHCSPSDYLPNMGVYARDQLNIQANVLPHFCLKVVCKKRGYSGTSLLRPPN